jgi:outer membrane lipoprotein SlyB
MFRKHAIPVVVVAVALAACATTKVQSAGGGLAGVTPANTRMLPAGSALSVRTNAKLSGKHNSVGDEFSVTVTDNLDAQNGEITVPEGAMIYGHITALQEAPHAGDPSVIRVDFDRIVVNGRSRAFNARVTKVEPPSLSNETLKKAGIGAAAGAVLGAIISGGELGGIATGGVIGAAAGTVISLGMDREPELPEGTRMTLRTTQATTLR